MEIVFIYLTKCQLSLCTGNSNVKRFILWNINILFLVFLSNLHSRITTTHTAKDLHMFCCHKWAKLVQAWHSGSTRHPLITTPSQHISQHKPIRTHSPRLFYDQCCCRPPPSPSPPCCLYVLSIRGIISLLLPASYVMYVCVTSSASLWSSTPPKSNLFQCQSINAQI